MMAKYEMPVFKKNWPRYSKRLNNWAKENGLEYSFIRADHGNYHRISFHDHYFQHIDIDELLKIVNKKIKGGER